MKDNIYATPQGEYGKHELPPVGTAYDDDHTVIICPVCKHKALDNYDICRYCGWEYDGFSEDHYSSENGATLSEYREEYLKAQKTQGGQKNV